MRVNKSNSPFGRSNLTKLNTALAALLVFGLTACDKTPEGTVGFVQGFGGIVTADEPRAVLSAQDVLSAGGKAADAMVRAYFTLAVTLPSTASLGGGGVCVVHDRDMKTTEVVDFSGLPTSGSSSQSNATLVPSQVRGLYALHAKYGKFRWEELVAEAERLARFGTPVSRALAADLAVAAPLMMQNPLAGRVFAPNGRVLTEGQNLVQLELATTLAKIRHAPGNFYNGPLAKELVDGANRVGAAINLEDLRNFRPQLRETVNVELGDDVAHFASTSAGTAAANIFRAVQEPYDDADASKRPVILAQASANNLLPSQTPQSAANVVVMDAVGNAAACSFSSNGLFGNGRMVPGAGFFLGGALAPSALAPVLVVNAPTNEVHYGAAAAGGVAAPMALVQTMLASYVEEKKINEAVDTPRIFSANQQITFAEGPAAAGALEANGYKVRQLALPARVNAMQCGSGTPNWDKCFVAHDPRGHGLSVVVGRD